MKTGTDGQAQPYLEIASPFGSINWVNPLTRTELIAHPEKTYLRQSDYMVQYINLLFGDQRIISDTAERRGYFMDAYMNVGGKDDFIERVGDIVMKDRLGPNEDWTNGYRQYWFDMAELYSKRSLVDAGGHDELMLIQEKISGSKKMEWIYDSLPKIDTIDGARESGTQLHNVSYEIAPVFGIDADVDSWRGGSRQAYEDFIHWVVESKI